MRRSGETWALTHYAVRRVPLGNGGTSTLTGVAEQLQRIMSDLDDQVRRAFVALSCSSAVIAHAELPRMPIQEVRSTLKLNGTRYLRRDFSNYLIDAVEVPGTTTASKDEKTGKMNVLVGGASRDDVAWYRNALQSAKIHPIAIDLAAVSVVNAFQASQPDVCEKEIVLLVDVGSRSTTINFLWHGIPLVTRIIPVAGLHLSEHVGQALALPAEQAEEKKIQMTGAIPVLVRAALSPLAREIRSSIDFFERQHECCVGKAFACGGSACSGPLIGFLSEEVGIQMTCWNPVDGFEMNQLKGNRESLVGIAPSLAAAIGVAVGRLR